MRFTSAKDIRQITILRDAYQRAFQDEVAHKLSAESLKIPAEFDLEEKEVRPWYRWNYKIGQTKAPPFSRVTLSRSAFEDRSEDYLTSALMTKTEEIIALGTGYINRREKSLLRRRGVLTAYGNLQEPRYLLIYVVMLRAKLLCTRSTNHLTLAQEYECLANFVSLVIVHVEEFKTSSTLGFHHFLHGVQDCLLYLKKLVLYHYQRQGIAEHLKVIEKLVENYQSVLAVYALYIISDAELDNSLTSSQITGDTRFLPSTLVQTPLFTTLKASLLQGNESMRITQTTVHSGIAVQIKNLKEAEDFLQTHFLLMIALKKLQEMAEVLRLLAECARIHGEYDLVHEETLSVLLETNLSFTLTVLAEIERNIEKLNNFSKQAFLGHEHYRPGFTNNRTYALQQFTKLQELKRLLVGRKDQIANAVAEIRAMNPHTKEVQRTELVRSSEQLIRGFHNTHLITNELVEKIAGMLPPPAEIERRNGMQPITSQEKWKTNFKTSFSDLYDRLQDAPQLLTEIEAILQQIDEELTVTAPSFLDHVQEINELARQFQAIVSPALTTLTSSITEAAFQEAEQILMHLYKKSSKTQYHGYYFYNFADLKMFCQTRVNFQWECYLKKIDDLLLQHPVYGTLVTQGHKLRGDLQLEIGLYFVDKDKMLSEKFSALQENWILQDINDRSLINYFESTLKRLKSKTELTHKTKTENKSTSPTVLTLHRLSQDLLLVTSAEALKNKLQELQRTLKTSSYTVRYQWLGRGEELLLETGKIKVPRHIKRMIECCDNKLPQANSLLELKKIRDEIFQIAEEALENYSSCCCRLFRPRDGTTQAIYQVFREAQCGCRQAVLPAK